MRAGAVDERSSEVFEGPGLLTDKLIALVKLLGGLRSEAVDFYLQVNLFTNRGDFVLLVDFMKMAGLGMVVVDVSNDAEARVLMTGDPLISEALMKGRVCAIRVANFLP